MYNGIGLASVRGTATSGHVQFNAGHVRNSSSWQRTWRNANAGNSGRVGGGDVGGRYNTNKLLTDEAIKEGATSLALHEKKRQLEVRLLELRDQLEQEGKMKDADIDKEVEWERERTLERWTREEEDRNARLLKQQQLQPNQGDVIEEGEEEGGIKLITRDGEKEKESDELVDATRKNDANREDNNRHLPSQRLRRWDNPPPSDRVGRRGTSSQSYHRGGKNAQALELHQQQRNARLRDAFGISDATHKEGEAFDRELQHAKKMEKQKEKEMQEKVARKLERQRIREERRDAKIAKYRGRGRDDDDYDEGKKRRQKKDNKRPRRRRSPSTSSGSETSSSYSTSSSSSSGSYSSRSSTSYSSSSSYSRDSRKARGRNTARGREIRRRGGRSYSSSPSRSRSISNSSRSRSGSRDAKRRATKDAKSRNRNASDGRISIGRNSSISPRPRPLSNTKRREVASSRSTSPESHSDDRDKTNVTRNGRSNDDQMSNPSATRTSEPTVESCRLDSRPTSPGAPSPPIPPASSHGGHTSNDDNAEDNIATENKSEEAPRISRRSRWGDRPVSLPHEKSPEPPAHGEGTESKKNSDPSPSPPLQSKKSSQPPHNERKSSASRSSDPARGRMKVRRSPSYSRSPSGSGDSSRSSSSSYSSDDSRQSRSRSHSSSPPKNRSARNRKRKQLSPSRSRSRSDSPPRRRDKKGKARRSPSYSSDSRSRNHSDDESGGSAPC